MARVGFLVITATLVSSHAFSANVKSKSSIGLGEIPSNDGIHSVSTSLKYMISSFPAMKTVAYTHIPDTIWRPLYIGDVSNPMGVVTDPLNSRLFVADQTLNKIFWYQLVISPDGLLKTDGHQHVAVDGVTAYWMAVNGVGDLYFSGQVIVEAPASSYRSVYRMDGEKISSGDAMNPVEVYSRSNSGFPEPKVWMPSGVAVDSFNVFWGNQEKGEQNGAVCSGTRQNTGVTGVLDIQTISKVSNEVRGMAIAGQNIFYLTPKAVYGADKSSADLMNPQDGQIQSAVSAEGWNPVSIAFDGEGTMYWTETLSGIIYQFPAMDTNPHPLHKYIDAPQVYGVTVFAKTGNVKGAAPTLKKNYGVLVSSAQVDESGVPAASKLHLLTALLSVSLSFFFC